VTPRATADVAVKQATRSFCVVTDSSTGPGRITKTAAANRAGARAAPSVRAVTAMATAVPASAVHCTSATHPSPRAMASDQAIRTSALGGESSCRIEPPAWSSIDRSWSQYAARDRW
jgi:hypothetical protein